MRPGRRPILLANARGGEPSRDFDGPGDVLIADGVIRDSRRGIGAAGVPEGTDIINCAGMVVAPGLIDMRAFVGEPGASHRETFASASQAAAAGGITTIICQPDTSPVIDNSATVDFVLRRARDTAIVNIHPIAALTKVMRGQEKAARATGWIGDGLAGFWAHAGNHRPDQRARREILPRARFRIFGVALQQPLINVALHVGPQHHPFRCLLYTSPSPRDS